MTATIDLSGAYIPGHGTPTLIIFARSRPSTTLPVTVLSNLRGEPSIPDDPSNGKVWRSVVKGFLEGPGYIDEFVDVASYNREEVAKHPWQFGGPATRLYRRLVTGKPPVSKFIDSIGLHCVTRADEIYVLPKDFFEGLVRVPI